MQQSHWLRANTCSQGIKHHGGVLLVSLFYTPLWGHLSFVCYKLVVPQVPCTYIGLPCQEILTFIVVFVFPQEGGKAELFCEIDPIGQALISTC